MCHKLMPILLVPCSINHLFLFQELVEKTVCVGALARAAHQEEAERWRDKWCVPSTCASANPARSRVLPARTCCI